MTSSVEQANTASTPKYGVDVTKLINDAESMIGTQYLYGGEGLVAEECMSSSCTYHKKGVKYIGVDCSGFIWNILKRQNIDIGRTTSAMSAYTGGQIINKVSDLISGDIVLFPGHVGLYIGNGNMIHAPRCGKTVCKSEIKYFNFTKGIRLTTNTKRCINTSTSYRILYTSISNKDEANSVVRKLYTEGITATVHEISVNGGIYYRVVSNILDDREVAEKELVKAKEIGYSNAFIEIP